MGSADIEGKKEALSYIANTMTVFWRIMLCFILSFLKSYEGKW